MADSQSTIGLELGDRLELSVGATFRTFEELKNGISDFGKSQNTLIVMGDSKKSKCHNDGGEGPNYEYATFVCKQGGKMQSSRNKGIRPNQSSLKCGCPVKMRAVASKNADGVLVYKITQASLEHNHAKSELVRANDIAQW